MIYVRTISHHITVEISASAMMPENVETILSTAINKVICQVIYQVIKLIG